MAETRDTHLRQANTKATAVGLLTDKKLEIKTDPKTGEKHIEGTVTVKTSDKNFVTFTVYSKEKKNDKTDNKAYAGLVTVMNEFQSVADVGDDNADYIRVNGQLNPYRGQNGNEIIGYRGSFFNRIRNVDNVVPDASFEVEMFIQSMVPEMGKDEDGEMTETGRLKITGWVPTYNGIEPVDLIVPEDLADACDNTYEPGQTVEFYGDIVNNSIEEIIEKPVAFGKPKKEVRRSFVNELIVTGGSSPYEGDEETDKDHVPYDRDTINAAITQRNIEIEEAKNKAKNGGANGGGRGTTPSGKAHGRSLNLMGI